MHRLYIGTFVLITLTALVYLIYLGNGYYSTELEERFYHPDHNTLKSSGAVGHGLGIIGTLMMLGGVTMYMMRKRLKALRNVGVLKYWLEFHIFLCTLGPILVLFHTAFKFGGIVSISFWSMVAVVASGVIGRFIYIQIPRTIQGRELSLSEVENIRTSVERDLEDSGLPSTVIMEIASLDYKDSGTWIQKWWHDQSEVKRIKKIVDTHIDDRSERRKIMSLIRSGISLRHRIDRLQTMQKLFRYWHVAHLPFALVMLVIMVVHVVVVLTFGYKWIL